jgi:hypothetical protein
MKKYLVLIIFWVCFIGISYSQTADEYFVKSADFFINGNTAEAKNVVVEGRQKFPDNQRLIKLEKLIDKSKNQPPPPQNQNQEPQQPKMNKEEAQQLLNALMQDEKQTKADAQKAVQKSRQQPEKDW